MRPISKTKTMLSGILLATVVFCLLFPQTVFAKSNEQAIIGVDSEDPGYPVKHPADDSRAAVVVVVASKYNSITDAYNIRFGYSANSGVSWQGWEWVASSSNEQDYPDVRIYLENGDSIRIVAVWQERDDGNSPWMIKACSKYYTPPVGWGSVIDISDTEDENDNIYPKIDTMVSGDGENYYHYWNIVWQRMNDDDEWEIKMYSSYYSTGYPTTFTNTIITDSDNSFRHPAVACNCISGNTCEAHIVYDAHIGSTHYVQVQSGYIDTNAVYNQYSCGPYNIDSDSIDSEIGYPDIASAGPGGHTSHPNGLAGQADVWIVWHHVNNSNKVMQCHVSDSLNGDPTGNIYILSSANGPSTSAVLRCVAVAMNEPSTSPVSAVWTDDSDVYFATATSPTFSWGIEQWTSTEETDIHVDVSMSTPSATTYSHVVWQRDSQTIYYAHDP